MGTGYRFEKQASQKPLGAGLPGPPLVPAAATPGPGAPAAGVPIPGAPFPVLAAVAILFLETFVAGLQAYVFTLLVASVIGQIRTAEGH